MNWSILILTQPSRRDFLARLLKCLAPQLHGRKHEIELLVKEFDSFFSIGANRQALVEKAKGEYITFVDDDDLVAKDYVAKLLALMDGADYVGFNVECYSDGVFLALAKHSLRYERWFTGDDGVLYRDLSYMNPIRRELARRSVIEGGFGEDLRWAARLREIGCVKTENYLDEVMYYYYHRTNKAEAAHVA